jgi:hypothetical protein
MWTGMGTDPYIRYTLDGSDPDDDGNTWDGTASQVWTDTMSDTLNQYLTLTPNNTPVTIKAQNFVYSGDSTIGYIGGAIAERQYTLVP